MGIWSKGRFLKKSHELTREFTESISFDHRLYAYDIAGSIAHVNMLAKSNIISPGDAETISKELECIRKEIATGNFSFSAENEDIHLHIEKALIDRLGDIGAKVHTARSRNDQIATDMRLYLRDEILIIKKLLHEMQKSLVQLGSQYPEVIIPGFTHLQHAQVVLFAHHLLAYVEMFHRDSDRLDDCYRRLNQLPLGAGALAGTTLPIDRNFVASALKFPQVIANSMDAVSDRDFVMELASDLAIVMIHISRLAEDIIFWMSQECSFIHIGEDFCTGSSLMPQKKNPDIAELSRGKAARVIGDLMTLLTLMKGLPMTYNRDMQEDKEPIFDAVDTTKAVLEIFAPMIQSIQVQQKRLDLAVDDPGLMATDLAEWLVIQGVPFRIAYTKVGKLVAYAETNDISLHSVSLEAMKHIIPEATEECLTLFSAEKSVRARNVFGGTAPEQVQQQLRKWREKLHVSS